MKQFLVGLLALSLAACGGGSSGGSTPPTSAPTSKPSTKVAFSVTSLGSHSLAVHKRQSGCSVSPSSVTLQAIPTSSPPANAAWSYNTGYAFVATEYDANCNALTSTPTYSISNTSIATTTIPTYVANVPTPAPGSVNVAAVAQGATTITASFPDGSSASVPIGAYGTMGVSCTSQNYFVYDGSTQQQYATPAWSAVNGYMTNAEAQSSTCTTATYNPTPPPFSADITDDNAGNIQFPYGYEVLGKTGDPLETLAVITSCSGFVSQGTTLSASTLQGSPLGAILFKTSTGACVKFYPLSNEQTSNSDGGTLVGIYAVSDVSGNFAY